MNIFLERYGQMLGAEYTGFSSRISLPPTLRVNTIKSSAQAVEAMLEREKVSFRRYSDESYVILDKRFSLGATPEYLQGHYYLQELASQIPVKVLDPRPRELVLDMCAAPGSKTTQIAALMRNTGCIIAVDKSKARINALNHNLERLGVTNTIVYHMDALHVKDLGMAFDRILLDAPCSGNFATDNSWFSKRTIGGVERNSAQQKRLVENAVSVLKPGGMLVYSTCSLEPEENELVVDWSLKNLALEACDTNITIGSPGLVEVLGKRLSQGIAKTRRFWPHKTNTQGFFIAKLKKR